MKEIADTAHSDAPKLHERMQAHAVLIASLAHKVNNPLTYVMNYLYLLKQSGRDKSAVQLIEKVEGGVLKATGILSSLVDVCHPRIEGKPCELNLGLLIEGVIAEACPGEGVRIVNSVTPSALAESHAEGLRIVLGNLLRNSLEAGADTVTFKFDGHALSVLDNGSGIPIENRSRIFDPFFTTKKGQPGLGLFEAYFMANALGISMSLGAAQAGGTEFSLRFPGQ